MKRRLKKVAMVVTLFLFGYFKRGQQFEKSGYARMSRIWFTKENGKETIHGLGDFTSYSLPFDASFGQFVKLVKLCKQSSYFDMWEW